MSIAPLPLAAFRWRSGEPAPHRGDFSSRPIHALRHPPASERIWKVPRGLEALKEPSEVSLSIDSQYVQLGISEWIHKWKRNGWRTSTKKDVLNKELWIELDAAVGRHKIRWEWVKGHAQHADNNRCDELANRAAREQVSSGGVVMVS